MKKKTILITGCSSGFGYETAKYLSQQGHTVIPTVRKKSDLSILPNTKLLDVTWSQNQIDEVVKEIYKKYGRIDVLINNAGYGYVASVEASTESQTRDQFEVNFFGTYKVIKSNLPIMRTQKSGLIINISSIVGLFSLPDYGIYSASKFAVEGLSQALRLEEIKNNIQVVAVNPGAYDTKFYKNSKVPPTVVNDYKDYGEPPVQIAKLIEKIIETKNPKANYLVGKEKHLVKLLMALPSTIRDPLIKKYIS